MGVSLNGVVPPKHPKMIIFSRKTYGCWVPAFRKLPYIAHIYQVYIIAFVWGIYIFPTTYHQNQTNQLKLAIYPIRIHGTGICFYMFIIKINLYLDWMCGFWVIFFYRFYHGIHHHEKTPFEQWKKPGWLGYIGDYTTQLYRDYNKPI